VSFPRPGTSIPAADARPPISEASRPDQSALDAEEQGPPPAAIPEIDLQAAIATDAVEVVPPTDDVALLNPDFDAIDHADPEVRMARIYFGNTPIGEVVSSIEPWPAGEEPVLVMPPPTDREIKRAALVPDNQTPGREKPSISTPSQLGATAETVAPKGEVTGPDRRLKSPSERLGLNVKDRARAEKCLAEAVYFEARGEPVRGQVAVAQVVMNRVFSGFYPGNVCGVVYQNAHRHLACQFTFACDNVRDVVREHELWSQAKQIARDTMDGKLWLPEIGKSTHYHASWVNPWWVRTMRKNARIGVHSFYRPRRWGDGADAPIWGPGVTVPVGGPTAAARPTAARM
jgi:spore germination cell wall hydrolase CwlJ-like protein